MKTVRLHSENGALWDWLQKNLPLSFRLSEFPWGYGYLCLIYRRGYKRTLVDRLLHNEGDKIATIQGDVVTLYHPEFYSDFEDLLRKYESDTKREPTLRYWEAA